MDTFADVDGAVAPGALADMLDLLASHPDVSTGKVSRDDALGVGPGISLLDIGCGSGVDTRRLAERIGRTGRTVGLDLSATMLRRAAELGPPWVEWCRGDALRLPFPDRDFDAVRVERTLQHVSDPARALTEAARVTRPAGVICVSEPDWGSLVLGGAPAEVCERFRERMRDRVRNPEIGRALPTMIRQAGFTVTSISAQAVACEGRRWFEPLITIAGIDLDSDASSRREARLDEMIAVLTIMTVVAHR